MIWVLFIMQLASHGSQAEEKMQFVPRGDHAEVSDSQHIISQLNTEERSIERLASCEIKPVTADDDNENIDANEETHLVIQDVPQCRICLDNEGDDLIAPCRCKGTQKYVHRSCLDNWRSTKEGFAFSHCTECRAAFLLRANVPPDRWWLRLKFQLLVVRDHTLIFFIVQVVVALLGMVVYRFYGEELREMFGYEEHPYAFYAMAKLTKEYIVEDLEGADQVPDLDPSHVTELKILGLY
ncbi:hypothetical protein ACP4OV_009636 [Aristida adscensionis]